MLYFAASHLGLHCLLWYPLRASSQFVELLRYDKFYLKLARHINNITYTLYELLTSPPSGLRVVAHLKLHTELSSSVKRSRFWFYPTSYNVCVSSEGCSPF